MIFDELLLLKLFDQFVFEAVYFLKLSPIFVCSFQSFDKKYKSLNAHAEIQILKVIYFECMH